MISRINKEFEIAVEIALTKHIPFEKLWFITDGPDVPEGIFTIPRLLTELNIVTLSTDALRKKIIREDLPGIHYLGRRRLMLIPPSGVRQLLTIK